MRHAIFLLVCLVVIVGVAGFLRNARSPVEKPKPEEAILPRLDSPEAYHTRGNAYADKAEWENAIPYYTEAIRLKPDYAQAYNSRGIAHENIGDLDKAIADHNKAIGLKPDDPTMYSNRAAVHRSK